MAMLRRPVLDKGHVRLLEWMGGDQAVIRAARRCNGMASPGPGIDQRLIRLLIKKGHNTPIEKAVMTWEFRLPIFVARQLMRHRIGSFQEQSMRYVESDGDFYVPSDDRLDQFAKTDTPEAWDYARQGPGSTWSTRTPLQAYHHWMSQEYARYQALLGAGWPREVARGVLGTAFYTTLEWNVNAWTLIGWLQNRLTPAAQYEHRMYAEAVLELWGQIMPLTCWAFLDLIAERDVQDPDRVRQLKETLSGYRPLWSSDSRRVLPDHGPGGGQPVDVPSPSGGGPSGPVGEGPDHRV